MWKEIKCEKLHKLDLQLTHQLNIFEIHYTVQCGECRHDKKNWQNTTKFFNETYFNNLVAFLIKRYRDDDVYLLKPNF